ncbi:MAG: DUF1566 domain-containing protein [Spirochaetales bacterium]|jgi:hypothetical protein|nr:DUF1566 domain-containing protein [Spirochaetales bacterium]
MIFIRPQFEMKISALLPVPIKTPALLFSPSARVLSLALCLIALLSASTVRSDDSSDVQNLSSDSGMINRAPLVASTLAPDNLDRISSDISNISESLGDILKSSAEETVIEVETVTEAENNEVKVTKALPAVAAPAINTPKNSGITATEGWPTKPLAATKKPVSPDSATLSIPPALATNRQEQIIAGSDHPDKNIPLNKYLKKDHQGRTLTDHAEAWHCVEDVSKGLMWEVKSSDGGILDKYNSYSWFQSSATEKPQGVADGGQCKGGINCDTLTYVQTVNRKIYCGHSDWRLPTREEMLSIVSFEKTSSTVTINSDYFPEALPSWYWTASSNENHPEYAWYVLFRNGIAVNDLKAHPKHVRLVRSQADKG